MKKLMLLPVVSLMAMLPGDSSGFPHGHPGGGRPAMGRPAAAARPAAPMHTPAFHPGAGAGRPAMNMARPAYHAPAFIPHPRPTTAGGGAGRRTTGMNRTAGGMQNHSAGGNMNHFGGTNNRAGGGSVYHSGTMINNRTGGGNMSHLGGGMNNRSGGGPMSHSGGGMNNRGGGGAMYHSGALMNNHIGGGNMSHLGGGMNNHFAGGRPLGGFGGQRAIAHRSPYLARGIYVNRSNGGLYRPGYARYYNNYAGWHHGYWGGWYGRPWLWGGGGLGAGWLLSSAYADYSNPYYSADLMPFFNYAQPIAVPDATLLDPGYGDDSTGDYAVDNSSIDDSSDPNITAATQLVDQARLAFKALDYDKAQQLIDKAVTLSPKDPTIHEFRALILFARQKYPEATAAIYDVLAVAPGWDWTTLQSFYADTRAYEQQLRALEAFAKTNPRDAGSRFLLAYQYLVIEDRGAAARMLRSVIALQPKDLLAAHLLQMLEGKGADPSRPTSGES